MTDPAASHPVLSALRDLGRLVLPVQCPGCGVWDQPLCRGCATPFEGPLRRCEDDVPRLDRWLQPPLPVWAVADYTGPVRGTVVAWKDRGRTDLTRTFRAVTERGGRELAPLVGAAADGPVRVVPIPSGSRAVRARGADLVRELAGGFAAGLRAGGVPAEVSAVLGRRAGGRDQVGLGARARGRNQAGRLRVRCRPTGPRSLRGAHMLVDDVVTTGSTLAAADDVLSGSGGFVLGAFVIARTPPPRDRSEPLHGSATRV